MLVCGYECECRHAGLRQCALRADICDSRAYDQASRPSARDEDDDDWDEDEDEDEDRDIETSATQLAKRHDESRAGMGGASTTWTVGLRGVAR